MGIFYTQGSWASIHVSLSNLCNVTLILTALITVDMCISSILSTWTDL